MLELIHCGACFQPLCAGVAALLLDDHVVVADPAVRLLFCLADAVEDAFQFLDIYFALVDFEADALARVSDIHLLGKRRRSFLERAWVDWQVRGVLWSGFQMYADFLLFLRKF